LQPAFILLDAEVNEIFRSSNSAILQKIRDLSQLLTPGFDVDPSFLYYTIEVKLDDQQLQGPSARRKGFLITIVSLNELRKNIPELKEIIYLDRNLLTDKIKIEVSDLKLEKKFSLIYFLLTTTGLLISAVLLGVFFVNQKILSPISNITKRVQSASSGEEAIRNEDEIEILDAIRKYQDNIKKNQSELIEQSKLSTLVSLATQVAHDIRSPLTALNMVISTLDKIPEEKRIIIRSAIQRINDIANDLLSRGKPARQLLSSFHFTSERDSNSESYSNVMLSSLVDSLVSEKRIQYRDKINVMIDLELSNSYGLFSFIPPNEVKTVLSNLINNSVEAFENESGRIILFLKEEEMELGLKWLTMEREFHSK
jgi:signal transduction histidine kinase